MLKLLTKQTQTFVFDVSYIGFSSTITGLAIEVLAICLVTYLKIRAMIANAKILPETNKPFSRVFSLGLV